MWLWLATAAIVVPSAVALGVGVKRYRDNDLDGWAVAFVITGAIFLLIGLLLPITTIGGRVYNRIECRSFAANTGRDTKFVVYTSFDSGTCLTPAGNNKWIPIDNLREFGSR